MILLELQEAIIELYRKVATCIPDDILKGLTDAHNLEIKGTPAYNALSTILNNIGSILWGKGELEKALDHYNQALEIRKKIGEKQGIADKMVVECGENS